MNILVTGATGNLGTAIVKFLQQMNTANLSVGVRDLEKAAHYKKQGLDVRVVNFDEPATLVKAFENIDRVLVMSTFGTPEQVVMHQKAVVEAAKEAGVNQLVYPSVINADTSDFYLAQTHRLREHVLFNSGIDYVILRNNWYVENEWQTVQGCLQGAPWVTAAGDGKVGWTSRIDLAEAAANVLVDEGHANHIYDLSGENLTQAQFVATLNDVANVNVQVLEVDDAAYAAMLRQGGVPENFVPMLVLHQQGMRNGDLEAKRSDLSMLLGRPETSLGDTLKQLLQG